MPNTPTPISGFAHPGRIARFQRYRSAIFAQFVATFALLVAIIVAATAVTMEIAEAEVLDSPQITASGMTAVAFFGLVSIGAGRLAARRRKR